MAIEDLLSSNQRKTANKKPVKKDRAKSGGEGQKKMKYKNIYMNMDTIDLLHKLTYKRKMTDNGCSFGDVIFKGLKLLDRQDEKEKNKK